MSITLSKLKNLGISVTLENDFLKVDAPKGVLNENDKLLLHQNKAEILNFLKRQSEPLPGKIERVRQAVFVKLHASIVEAWQRGEPTTDSERLGDAVDALSWQVIHGKAEMSELETATILWVQSFRKAKNPGFLDHKNKPDAETT